MSVLNIVKKLSIRLTFVLGQSVNVRNTEAIDEIVTTKVQMTEQSTQDIR